MREVMIDERRHRRDGDDERREQVERLAGPPNGYPRRRERAAAAGCGASTSGADHALLAAVARGIVHRLVEDLQLALLRRSSRSLRKTRCAGSTLPAASAASTASRRSASAAPGTSPSRLATMVRTASRSRPPPKSSTWPTWQRNAHGVGGRAELLDQPGLADAGVAPRWIAAPRPATRQSAIRRAADRARGPAPKPDALGIRRRAASADGAPARTGFAMPLTAISPAILAAARGGRLVDGVRDQRLAGSRRALQPRRQVHGVAGHGVFAMALLPSPLATTSPLATPPCTASRAPISRLRTGSRPGSRAPRAPRARDRRHGRAARRRSP